LVNEARRAELSSQVAKAGANCTGEGLAVAATTEGARLRCAFQQLEGEATRGGLWLTSSAPGQPNDHFRVMAVAVGREGRAGSALPAEGVANIRASRFIENGAHGVTRSTKLPVTGGVSVDGQTGRFVRPGLVEEYSVSMDGVRQDFVVMEKPGGASVPASRLASSLAPSTEGHLRVELAVTGARVEPIAGDLHPVSYAEQAMDHERSDMSSHGARLVLEGSNRKIAYSRLRVTDATGKELAARMEVVSGILPDVEGAHSAARNVPADFFKASLPGRPESAGLEAPALRQAGMPAATALAVLVDDAQAVYPIRIDPTFSDANWSIMNPGIPGANDPVSAAVADGSGNLYIGGSFSLVGDVVANRIAKWNGSSWSALGSGMEWGAVYALALSGDDLYAAGRFTTAGGVAATNIARWNGSSWSALGSGMNDAVGALAVLDGELYAGGAFTMAGGASATYIARWNGSSWSALGFGVNNVVSELAVLGGDLYVAGSFTMAGGNPANHIAKWNGSNWSAFGSGIGGGNYPGVRALAVSGSDLYVGGSFTTAGSVWAANIAKWNGNDWSALGLGMNAEVNALAVSGGELYTAGRFTTAGAITANGIAKWNGSDWSALGSGMNGSVTTLAVSANGLYVGGGFRTAGTILATNIAQWNGSAWSALGSGVNGYVSALALSGSDLYVGACLQRQAEVRPVPSPNGLAAVGARSTRELVETTTPMSMRWRCRAATCMLGALSRPRAGAWQPTSPSGTAAIGARWARA
jgi:hypothetical protein